MKRIGKFVATVLLVGLPVVAQAPPESGWLALFNGKDLAGWKAYLDPKKNAENIPVTSQYQAPSVTIANLKPLRHRLRVASKAESVSCIAVPVKADASISLTTIPQFGPGATGRASLRAGA